MGCSVPLDTLPDELILQILILVLKTESEDRKDDLDYSSTQSRRNELQYSLSEHLQIGQLRLVNRRWACVLLSHPIYRWVRFRNDDRIADCLSSWSHDSNQTEQPNLLSPSPALVARSCSNVTFTNIHSIHDIPSETVSFDKIQKFLSTSLSGDSCNVYQLRFEFSNCASFDSSTIQKVQMIDSLRYVGIGTGVYPANDPPTRDQDRESVRLLLLATKDLLELDLSRLSSLYWPQLRVGDESKLSRLEHLICSHSVGRMENFEAPPIDSFGEVLKLKILTLLTDIRDNDGWCQQYFYNLRLESLEGNLEGLFINQFYYLSGHLTRFEFKKLRVFGTNSRPDVVQWDCLMFHEVETIILDLSTLFIRWTLFDQNKVGFRRILSKLKRVIIINVWPNRLIPIELISNFRKHGLKVLFRRQLDMLEIMVCQLMFIYHLRLLVFQRRRLKLN